MASISTTDLYFIFLLYFVPRSVKRSVCLLITTGRKEKRAKSHDKKSYKESRELIIISIPHQPNKMKIYQSNEDLPIPPTYNHVLVGIFE